MKYFLSLGLAHLLTILGQMSINAHRYTHTWLVCVNNKEPDMCGHSASITTNHPHWPFITQILLNHTCSKSETCVTLTQVAY